MPASLHLLERAISFWKNGQNSEARKIFETIIYNDRQNENAWLWYIYTAETNREKIAALENFLKIFPENSVGKKVLATLRAESLQPEKIKLETTINLGEAENVHAVRSRPTQSVQSVHRPISSVYLWTLVSLGLCFILVSSSVFLSRYKSLQSSNRELTNSNRLITDENTRLNRDIQMLNDQIEGQIDQYNGLVTEYDSLNTEYSILWGNYQTLYDEQTQLLENYNTLMGDYSLLNNIAIKPPYIVVHDRQVDTTFYDADGQLTTWTTPFAGLEDAIENGGYMRRLIVDENTRTYSVENLDGDPLWLRDFSVFITPDTFLNVIPQLYYKSSNPYDFLYRLWYMIGQLSNYASEELETPRYSLETLLAGGGDCEDLSILMVSMIKAAPVNWFVDLVYVDADNINAPQKANHVVVYVNTGKETYIIETTSDQEMLPYYNGITGWLASELIRDVGNLRPVYLR